MPWLVPVGNEGVGGEVRRRRFSICCGHKAEVLIVILFHACVGRWEGSTVVCQTVFTGLQKEHVFTLREPAQVSLQRPFSFRRVQQYAKKYYQVPVQHRVTNMK